MRIESDALGELDIAEEVYWGINTQRALANFPASRLPQYYYFYKALSQVKLSAAQTNFELGYIPEKEFAAIRQALEQMISGEFLDNFVVDPLQGGAGTSVNMNINEIAANRATEILGGRPGEYRVDPLEQINLHQSTNDVYPTAVKIAVYYFLTDLETALNSLLQVFQDKEKEFASIIKIGRTELIPAVPYTLGAEFSAFADALARDRWRIFKSMERIRQINLGGTAIGTSLTAPRDYVLRVGRKLKELTGLPLAQAENLIDATQNHDQLAEVFAMIKVLALDLEKIAGDLRRLTMLGEIEPARVQIGSSIMPGKYNPVILEMVQMVAKKVIGNELTSSIAISQGELELNAFLPLAAYSIFESCDILTQAVRKLNENCLEDLKANEDVCRNNLLNSPSLAAILLPKIGYKKASEVSSLMQKKKIDIKEAVKELKVISAAQLEKLLEPSALMSMSTDE